jgi:hypothetical protein
MTKEIRLREIEQGGELPPPMDRPRDAFEFAQLISEQPERIHDYYSDDDIRAIVPSLETSERIIELANRSDGATDV